MKLLFITYPLSPFNTFGQGKVGGGQVNLYNLLQHLPPSLEVELITNTGNFTPAMRIPKNLTLTEFPLIGNSQKEITELSKRLVSYVKGKNYDLIHTHYYLSGIIGLKLKKELHLPLIQSFWTLEKVKQNYLPDYEADQARIENECQIVQNADAIIANTRLEKADLVSFYKSEKGKVIIIPPGISQALFKPIERNLALKKLQLNSSFRYLLFVGRMDPIKGLPLLIKAMCDIHAYFPDVKLIITGGDKNDLYWKSIQETVCDCELKDCVIMLEAQPYPNLPYLYNSATLTIMPSYHETFGLVALESMACGTPVVASKVGGLTTFIKDRVNSFLVPPHNQKKLTTTIIEILQDKKQLKAVKQQAQKTTQDYSWEKIVPKYLKLYEKLLSKTI